MLQQIGAVVAAELCQQHGLDAEDAHHPAGNGALISARMCDELLETPLHVAARRPAAAASNSSKLHVHGKCGRKNGAYRNWKTAL